jgi:hypothetical protein
LSLRRAPAYTSQRLILRGLDAEQTDLAFREHAVGLVEGAAPPSAAVAIDGKTLCGSFDAFHDRKAAHVLSAFAADGQIVLAHLALEQKSNEIPAAQDMIASMGLTGRLFSLSSPVNPAMPGPQRCITLTYTCSSRLMRKRNHPGDGNLEREGSDLNASHASAGTMLNVFCVLLSNYLACIQRKNINKIRMF